MSKPKKDFINAKSLRIGLLIIMLLISAGGAFGIGYALQTLKAFAVEVSHKKIDASASSGNLSALKNTESYLAANQDVLEKAGLLVSPSEFPEFKIVDEVRKIAARNNVQVESFSYGSEAASGTSGGAATPTPAATGTTATPAAPAATSGGKTIALTVTLKASDYLSFLQFTYDIEQHLPKMKINGISVSGGETGIAVDPITVEMYIK